MSAARRLVQETQTIENHLRDKKYNVKLPHSDSRQETLQTTSSSVMLESWNWTDLLVWRNVPSAGPWTQTPHHPSHVSRRTAFRTDLAAALLAVGQPLAVPRSPSLTSSFVFAFHTCLPNCTHCSTLLSLRLILSTSYVGYDAVSRYKYSSQFSKNIIPLLNSSLYTTLLISIHCFLSIQVSVSKRLFQ